VLRPRTHRRALYRSNLRSPPLLSMDDHYVSPSSFSKSLGDAVHSRQSRAPNLGFRIQASNRRRRTATARPANLIGIEEEMGAAERKPLTAPPPMIRCFSRPRREKPFGAKALRKRLVGAAKPPPSIRSV